MTLIVLLTHSHVNIPQSTEMWSMVIMVRNPKIDILGENWANQLFSHLSEFVTLFVLFW